MSQHLRGMPLPFTRLEEIVDGASRTVFVGGRAVALWRIGQDLYAADDVCSHIVASIAARRRWIHHYPPPARGSV